ncbi:TonB-dependent receptor [Thermomonas carbonis]|nr:TonB-dependent receptor [Thermomonas carbonis]
MASNNFATGLKRSALTVALGMCFVGGVQAQSNSAGAVTGRAASGDTITITNPATGFSRTITVDGSGSYRFSALPTGQYQLSRNGGATRPVTVNVGSAANIDFVSSGGDATTLDTVTVVGSGAINPIDVSSVESTTILTAEQIAKIPVARDTTAVALLAPGTVRGDAAFGNLASFGGASVAENQYFFNGFNITNSFNNLNFAQVPFEAIAEQQTKTGGYGAEFGRSTGGVVNQISRRGTNEFMAGGNIFYTPGSMRETFPNQVLNDGTVVANNSNDKFADELTAAVWAGGALVKDRLFAYGLVQYTRIDNNLALPGTTAGKSSSDINVQPKWLLKMDWNISDNHIIEFTGISDKREIETDYFTTTVTGGIPNSGVYTGTEFSEFGGNTYIGKYTGYLSDNFTLSVLAGTTESARGNYSVSSSGLVNEYNGTVGVPAAGCPVIVDARPSVVNNTIVGRSGCSIADILGRPDAKDTRDQFRIDAEWQLGDHLLRAGIDIDNFESVAGESYSGGAVWRYGRYAATGNTSENEVVRKRVFQSGSTVAVDQTAYYIEDSWSVTDNFIAYMGLRWDNFKNMNGEGETFAEIKNQFAPRLGFSWDVFGDSTFKVYGNAGRYALPLTATVAVRGASKSLFSEQYYTYTGVDPVTGAPTGLTLIDNPANGRPIRYLNNEFGVGKNPETIADVDLKPMYQDEYILGMQKQITDSFSLGARLIHRDLKAAIDDQCDYRPLLAWAFANGFTDNGSHGFQEVADKTLPTDVAVYNPGFAFCHLYNPGEDATFRMDVNGDGVLETVEIDADVLGPKAKRKYTAFEVFFESSFERGFLQGSYTFAKNIGNTEGGVKSDIGQDDTGTTQDFDYPELAEGSYGYLPNDRRHSLKLFGSYDLTDTVSIGGNFSAQSGRPINCFGYHPISPNYGNSYFYCDGEQVDRGTAGRTPWTQKLDMNVSWQPAFASDKLTFKVDVFNVFNSRKPVTVNEFGEDAGGNLQPNVYKSVNGWQTPRAVRFMVQYDF